MSANNNLVCLSLCIRRVREVLARARAWRARRGGRDKTGVEVAGGRSLLLTGPERFYEGGTRATPLEIGSWIHLTVQTDKFFEPRPGVATRGPLLH